MADGEIFDVMITKFDEIGEVHFINIPELHQDLKNLIDLHLVEICSSAIEDIETTKKVLKNFFDSKDEKTKMGALAEFIVHLYLKNINFKQECLFLNLEEGSIKKGFDGYYSIQSEEWIMESKSGKISTDKISHLNKVKEACKDLSNKLKGVGTNNNPWMNAFNHAKNIGSSEDILKNIKDLSKRWINEDYVELNEVNIIPAATIFHENTWESDKTNRAITGLEDALRTEQFKALTVICINKRDTKTIEEYLTL
ncbi:MAG: hypothetical protein MRY83_12335 [Flavobacteriales bacterium]|nr:hypothetical protein [Flavobacteriales bacterium]